MIQAILIILVFVGMMVANFVLTSKINEVADKYLPLNRLIWPYRLKKRLPAHEWKLVSQYRMKQMLLFFIGILVMILLLIFL